jgi:CheY-like chemotaxis protein
VSPPVTIIKAIAVQQPEVTRLAAREVSIDVKTWTTDYRGPILLVSATTPRIEPAGYAIALARLVDCRPMTKEDERRAGKSVYPGARAWVYEEVEPLRIFPVDVRSDVFDVAVPSFGLRTISRVVLVPESYQRAIDKRAGVPRVRRATPSPWEGIALPPAPRQGGRLDVLVVVAYEPVARGIQRLLSAEHDARVATTVEKALEQISGREPDAVICDSELGMEGCARLLGQLARANPRVRRILYSSSRPEIWLRASDGRAVGRLVHRALLKPATEQQLLGAVAS